MIWRIFRKDWAQLWILVAVLTVIQGANAAIWIALGPFEEPKGLLIFAQILSYLAVLAAGVLITATVQQEVLVGTSQDWLIRPVRRGALLSAKLLFVLITVHVPMLLADLAHGVASGFPLGAIVAGALTRSACTAAIFDLPVFAIAALTRTMLQAAGTMLAIWFIVVIGITAGIVLRGGEPPPFAASGMQWMTPAYWSVLALGAAGMIVALQYRRRATSRARAILAGAVLLAPLLSFSSWTAAFTVQRLLSPDPAMAQPMTITFEPGRGRAAVPPTPMSAGTVLLPVRITGVVPGAIVLSDRAFIRLIGHDGTVLYRGRTVINVGYGDDFAAQAISGGEAKLYQRIILPDEIYKALRARSVRAEIDYSLTLFRVAGAATIRALNGNERFDAFGWCRTAVDADGDDIELGCEKVGNVPQCVTVMLENPRSGLRNPQAPFCEPDYAPFSPHWRPDAMSHFGADIRFQDLQQLARYPVDGSQLHSARVALTSYEPTAHLTRQLVIADIKLGDWAADAKLDAARVR